MSALDPFPGSNAAGLSSNGGGFKIPTGVSDFYILQSLYSSSGVDRTSYTLYTRNSFAKDKVTGVSS
jgi:hypothetical protein